MELRSKSRPKRAASTLRTGPPPDIHTNRTQEVPASEVNLATPSTESAPEPKRIKLQESPTSNTTRYSLRKKLDREKSASPRITSPRSKLRASVRSQKASVPTPVSMNNRTISNQSSVVSSGMTESEEIKTAVGGRVKRESNTRIKSTSSSAEAHCGDANRLEPPRLRNLQTKKRISAERSFGRNIDPNITSSHGSSSQADICQDEKEPVEVLEDKIEPEVPALDTEPMEEDEERQDQDDDSDQSNSFTYEEALRRQIVLSEETSQFSLIDSEAFFSTRVSEAMLVLEKNQDPMIQLTILQNLSESLSVASEESFLNFSRIRSLVTTLVKVMSGSYGPLDDDTFLSLSSAGVLDEHNDIMILACRCLCNLLEASPGTIETVATSDAVKIFLPHLRHLRCIELGEQIIQLLRLLSHDSSGVVVRERGVLALVKYLDFFSTQVQRTAILSAANLCRHLEVSHASEAGEALEYISNTLGSTDSIIVENSCLLLKNLVERFRNYPSTLEQLFSAKFVGVILTLLEPGAGAQPEPKIYSSLMILVSDLAKTSSAMALVLLQKRMILILKHNISGECSNSNNNMQLEKSLELAYNLLPQIPEAKRRNELIVDTALYLEFSQIMAPVALRLYKGSASPSIKLNSLTLLFKIVVFAPKEANKGLAEIPLASFLSGLIAGSAGSLHSLRALQILIVLLERIPLIFETVLVREGVPAAIEKVCAKKPTDSPPADFWTLFEHIEAAIIPKTNIHLFSAKSAEFQKAYLSLAQSIQLQFFDLSKELNLTKKDNGATAQLRSIFLGLNAPFRLSHENNYRENLFRLKDLLHKNDVTTFELAFINFAGRLHYFLCSRKETVSQAARQEMFFDVFMDGDDLSSTNNLIHHLHARLEQIEAYQMTLFSQSSVNSSPIRPLLQTCRLRLAPVKGTPSNSIEVVVQLAASFSLVIQHLRKCITGEETASDLLFKLGTKHLDSSGTVLKALLKAEVSLVSLNEVISITYCKLPKSEPIARKSTNPSSEKASEPDAILRVLRVLHGMANKWPTEKRWRCTSPRISPDTFTNAKLAGKLSRQLQEVLLVVSECLPFWCSHLMDKFAFLFPFSLRMEYLQATAFGADRLIAKHLGVVARPGEVSESFGRMSKLKFIIPRTNLLESAKKIFKKHLQDRSILEVQFRDEVGSGQGPTLEFFSCVFRSFCQTSLGLWRESDPSTSEFVNVQLGLFPAPSKSWEKEKALLFEILGWFTAKSLIDSRITDLPLSEAFLELLMCKDDDDSKGRMASLSLLKMFDPAFADSLFNLHEMANDSTDLISPLEISFLVPGTKVELVKNGANVLVTKENVSTFIDLTLDHITNGGIQYALSSFRKGFDHIFPFKALSIFSSLELTTILGNGEEDWSYEVIYSSIKAEHGYTGESLAITRFVTILSNFEVEERRNFLQFITGSRKLPIGGFRALSPNLTIVRKLCDTSCPDYYLPSVNTCFNYLKLPDYSCEAVMKRNLFKAMEEGKMSFHLS